MASKKRNVNKGLPANRVGVDLVDIEGIEGKADPADTEETVVTDERAVVGGSGDLDVTADLDVEGNPAIQNGETVDPEESDNPEDISARREKNLALSIEDIQKMIAKLFSGNFDYNATQSGVYKGYHLRNIKSPAAKSIIDTFTACNAEIKLYQDLDDGKYYIQLITDGKEQELISLAEFNGSRGDTILLNRKIVTSKIDLASKRDFISNFTSMPENINYFHRTIGFDRECRWFKGINTIDLSGEQVADDKVSGEPVSEEPVEKQVKIESRLKPGNDTVSKITRVGSLEDFKDGVRTLIKPYPLLTFALAVGVYGVILQWLDLSGKVHNKENLVVNISADETGVTSSFGKSIACKLMLMLFGNPEELLCRYDITRARRDEVLKELGVVPMCTDDFGVGISDKSQRDRANIIREYVFDGHFGVTKDVYGKRAVKYYSPLVTSTETSILKELAAAGRETGGLRRLLEITCKPGELTVDGEHADLLEKFMLANHGFIDDFMQALCQKGITIDKISEEIADSSRQLKKLNMFKGCHYADIGEAWIDRLAIISICVELLNRAFDFEGDEKLDYIGVVKVLLGNIKDNLELFSQYRNIDKTVKETVDAGDVPLYYEYYGNILNNYAENKGLFKESKALYKKEIIDRVAELENVDTGFYKAADERNKLLTGCIGFEDFYAECNNRCLFIKGEQNIKWLMGIENKSNDEFKSIVRMMIRDGVMFRGSGQGDNANTVKLKIGSSRTNYYVVNLGFFNDIIRGDIRGSELAELSDIDNTDDIEDYDLEEDGEE